MKKIKTTKLKAYEWLERELTGFTWSRHEYDTTCKVDRTNNNTSECFNSWILNDRDKPCMTMLEEVRCRLIERFTERSKEAATWSGIIPPRIGKALDKAYKKGKKMNVMASGNDPPRILPGESI